MEPFDSIKPKVEMRSSYNAIDRRVLKQTIIVCFWITILSLVTEFGLYLWFPLMKIMIPLSIFGVVYPIILMRDMIDSLANQK